MDLNEATDLLFRGVNDKFPRQKLTLELLDEVNAYCKQHRKEMRRFGLHFPRFVGTIDRELGLIVLVPIDVPSEIRVGVFHTERSLAKDFRDLQVRTFSLMYLKDGHTLQ